MSKKISVILFLLMFCLPLQARAMNEVNVYFFYSNSCNICSQEKVYLEALQQRYPNMKVYQYETSGDANHALMSQAKEMYNVSEGGVPFTIIGDTTFLGFSQAKKSTMQQTVYQYSLEKYDNQFGKQILNIEYRTDLEGEPQKYEENDNYKVEESSGKTPTTQVEEKKPLDTRYRSSIILISVGVMIGITVVLISIFERRHRS